MEKIKIIVADDHQIVRLGLTSILSQQEDLQVIAEAADGLQALQMVRNLNPHVLILDLMMPVLNGMAVIDELNRSQERPRIIVLSMHLNEAYVTEALGKGADGYVVKDSIAAEIINAVREVASGRHYLSSQLRDCPAPRSRGAEQQRNTGRDSGLTKREQEILYLIAQGRANKEISDQLCISIRTVETHRSKIMRKTGIKSHAGLIHYAMRENFLSLP